MDEAESLGNEAGQEARRSATEGAWKPENDCQSKLSEAKPTEAKVSMANAEVPQGGLPEKCTFTDTVGWAEMHLPWKCRALRELVPKERGWKIKDNGMCLFCLLHGKEEICYAKKDQNES